MTLNQIIRDIRIAAEFMVAEGRDINEIKTFVTLSLLQTNRVVSDEINDMLQSVELLSLGTATPLYRSEISELYRLTQSAVARQNGVIVKDIENILVDGFAKGKSSETISAELEYKLNVRKSSIQTIVETSARGFDRVSNITAAEKAGITSFRYDGPKTNIRPFCEELMKRSERGQTWTLDQIRAMDNGQGLPVHVHCGGYNCRHRWKPVFS